MPNDVVAALSLQIDANTVKLRAEMDRAAKETRKSMTEIKASVAEAKGSIALLGEEIGVHLNRHLRGFVANLPGVAAAMSAAFNAVAVIGLGVAAYEAGKKIVEFFERTRKASEKAREETEKFIDGFRKTNLELAVAADKLEEATAKLQHKPGDGLKTALDEAKLAAFELEQQLDRDIEATQTLMKTQGASWWQRVLTGMSGGSTVLAQNEQYKDEEKRINAEQNALRSRAKTVKDEEQVEQDRVFRLSKLQQGWVDKLDEEIQARKRLQDLTSQGTSGPQAAANFPEIQALNERFRGSDGDQTSILNQLRTFHDNMLEEQQRSEIGLRTMQDQVAYKQAQGAAEELQRRKQAAQHAREADRKAQEEQMKGFEQELAGLRESHLVDIEEEHSFWLTKLDAITYGSDNYQKLLLRLGEEEQQILLHQAEQKRKDAEFLDSIERQEQAQSDKDVRQREKELQKALANSLESQKLTRQDASDAYHDTEESTAAAVQSGDMTPKARLSALQQALQQERQALQQSFGQEYTLQLQSLDSQRQLYGESSDEYKQALEDGTRHLQEILLQRQKMQADSDKQAADLSRQAMEQGWQGALNDMTRRTADLQGQLKSLIESSVASANNTIANMMTGDYHHGDWKKTGKQIFGNIAKTGLEDAEGFGLKALGIKGVGKMGTQSNPMWVKSADEALGSAAGGLSGLFSNLGGQSGGGDGGGWGSLLTTALGSFIPKADGGLTYPGNYLVGERGPELLRLGSGGYIHNHRDTRDILHGGGGGDTHHNYHIDARGATDPMAVKRMVHQGIMEAAPHIAAATIKTQNDIRARTPSMRA